MEISTSNGYIMAHAANILAYNICKPNVGEPYLTYVDVILSGVYYISCFVILIVLSAMLIHNKLLFHCLLKLKVLQYS